MHYTMEPEGEKFHPRMIIWQLTDDDRQEGTTGEPSLLTTQECLLILESIARLAKPIIVLTGKNVILRRDLYDIVEYGGALGLKVIVEAEAEDLSDEIIRKFSTFGPKTFRILIGNVVKEGQEQRFERTAEFLDLEEKVRTLKKAGFEIHLSLTVGQPDARQLAINHDYAFRNAADGFYCHLSFKEPIQDDEQDPETDDTVGDFIESIASVKQYSPDHMYFSPQCVKYGFRDVDDWFPGDDDSDAKGSASEWRHWCLGGKTFAFISERGKVQVCSGLPIPCGDLRNNGYNFQQIWQESEVFQYLRDHDRSCTKTRDTVTATTEPATRKKPNEEK